MDDKNKEPQQPVEKKMPSTDERNDDQQSGNSKLAEREVSNDELEAEQQRKEALTERD